MKLELLKELLDQLDERRGATRDPGQRPKSADKKIKGDVLPLDERVVLHRLRE